MLGQWEDLATGRFVLTVLANKIIKNSLDLPPPALMPAIEDPIPYFFVGDEAFPLSENLMRSYPRRSVAHKYENKVFNYRLSRARQTVECSFGILASRFRVFRSPFEIKVSSVVKVVKAACVLHNYLRNSPIKHSEGELSEQHMPLRQLCPLRQSKTRSASRAFSIRQNITNYFNSPVGSVPWQRDCIMRGKF